METMSFDEVRATPEKLDALLKEGKTVAVTKNGKPHFTAVPTQQQSRRSDLDRKIDELWAGANYEWTTEQIVSFIRQSRE